MWIRRIGGRGGGGGRGGAVVQQQRVVRGHDVARVVQVGLQACVTAAAAPREARGGGGALRTAALAASIFHYGTYTVGDLKNFLKARGVEVRPAEVRR